MVHAEDRSSAIDRLRRALDETVVGGVQTDAGFLRWLVDDAAFVGGEYDTGLIEGRWGLDHPVATRRRGAGGDGGARGPPGLRSRSRRDRPPAIDGGSAWGRVARREARRR